MTEHDKTRQNALANNAREERGCTFNSLVPLVIAVYFESIKKSFSEEKNETPFFFLPNTSWL